MNEVRAQLRRQTGKSNLADSAIDIDEGRALWPLDTLSRLSDSGRCALTERVMLQLAGDERWRVTHIGGAFKQGWVPDMTWFPSSQTRAPSHPDRRPTDRRLRWNDELVEIDGVEQPLPFVRPSVTD